MSPELIGWVAACLSTCSFMPQAYTTLRTRNTEGLSLAGFTLIFTSIVCWLLYGIALGDGPLIATNIVSATTSGIVLAILVRQRVPVIIARYRNRKAAADIAAAGDAELPPVTDFSRGSRFLRPRRRRKNVPAPAARTERKDKH